MDGKEVVHACVVHGPPHRTRQCAALVRVATHALRHQMVQHAQFGEAAGAQPISVVIDECIGHRRSTQPGLLSPIMQGYSPFLDDHVRV